MFGGFFSICLEVLRMKRIIVLADEVQRLGRDLGVISIQVTPWGKAVHLPEKIFKKYATQYRWETKTTVRNSELFGTEEEESIVVGEVKVFTLHKEAI